MHDDPNFWDCYERIPDDLDPAIAALIEASFAQDDGESLRSALSDGSATHAGTRPPNHTPPKMYLQRIDVKGFRGIGPAAHLELHPGPGLTVVTGRNGCGKSSFAEALELALTGRNSRWTGDRAKELQSGWRNLHDGSECTISAHLSGDGGNSSLQLAWPDACTNPSEATFTARVGDEQTESRVALNWAWALKTYNPILTYAGLGDLTGQKKSALYDQLHAMLGLGSLKEAIARLATVRKEEQAARKQADAERKQLLASLDALEDPRAQRAYEALQQRSWGLDEVERQVDDNTSADAEGHLLRALSRIRAPNPEAIGAAVEEWTAAQQDALALQGTQAAQAQGLAQLLTTALASAPATHCQLCEQPLPDGWRETTTERLAQAHEAATQAARAQQSLRDAARQLKQLIPPLPVALEEAGALGEQALIAWRELLELSPGDQLHASAQALHEAVAELHQHVVTRRDERAESWGPVKLRLIRWLPLAQQSVQSQPVVKRLKAAESWLTTTEKEIVAERFAPIETRTKQIWEALRQRSHVELTSVALNGSGRAPRRGVDLSVSVDGETDVALGVMSQGELYSLALSLFLPRLTHDQSPFRFVVLDDPVQAMDAYKVDGLAQVLSEVAKTRQVVVFTHDARLPEAIRRLRIDADLLRVVRSEQSVVAVQKDRDPVRAYLNEAYAISNDAHKIGPGATKRIIPAFCRNAIEAFFGREYQRRALADGIPIERIDEQLATAKTTTELGSLALFGDLEQKHRQGVLGTIRKRAGSEGVALYQACKKGAHDGWDHHHAHRIQATWNLLEALGWRR